MASDIKSPTARRPNSSKDKYWQKRNSDDNTVAPASDPGHKSSTSVKKDTQQNTDKKYNARSKPYITQTDSNIVISCPDLTLELLNHIKKNNYEAIMAYINDIDRKDHPSVTDFCRCMEHAVGIMRLTADNTVRKMMLAEYQQDLFNIMRSAGEPAENLKNTRQRDLEDALDAFLGRLESHAALTGMLKNHGVTEENLDKEMSEALLKF